ncbi:probable catalytic subunit of dna polymerase zeta upr-1 [Ceraceosorus bombacis]|uniref:DNA polymerase n=1 Tax=Ceraceosorus bombacis TaxID=401625 RepID=A0A0P1BLH6_9BASI|nr:probable catalytic subunit of dna polymerase zeta upr-1 [Ceraceosorus bombacis]
MSDRLSHPEKELAIFASDETMQQHSQASKKESATSFLQQTPLFRLRLINIDHVLCDPTPYDRATSAFNPPDQPLLRKVPVLRIFGATPQGQRVCCHVHGVFPYTYIEYTGSLRPDFVLSYISRLGRSLNACISASLRKLSTTSSHIASIHLVQGVPFYGYHVAPHYFLKISFVDPTHNFRLATILQSGKVLGTKFQPYECHIRYLLQFMLDYNLYGCDFVDLEHVKFRLPVPESAGDNLGADLWTSETIAPSFIQDDMYHRISFCALEIDTKASSILNRRLLKERPIHSKIPETRPSSSALAQKLVPSLTDLWQEEQKRRKRNGLPPSIPEPDSVGEKRKYKSGEAPRWMASDRFDASLSERLAVDAKIREEKGWDSKVYEGGTSYDRYIVSAFDSVELFHSEHEYESEPTQIQAGPDQEFEGSIGPRMYDLEFTLTQRRATQQQARSNPASSVSGSPTKLNSVPSSQSAEGNDVNDAGQSSLDDLLSASQHTSTSLDEDVDTSFFQSSAFQEAMREVEKAAIGAERSENLGDEHDPLDLMPKERTPDASRSAPTTPSRRGRFVPRTPTSLRKTSTSTQSTPAKRPNDAFVTPTKTKQHKLSEGKASETSVTRAQARSPDAVDEATPKRSATDPIQPGSGADKMRQYLGCSQEWRVRPDSDLSQNSHSQLSQTGAGHDQSTRRDRMISNQSDGSLAIDASRGVRFADSTMDPAGPSVCVSHQRMESSSSTGKNTGSSTSVTEPSASYDSLASASDRSVKPTKAWQYGVPAPLTSEVVNSFGFFGLPTIDYQDPYYSNPADVPKSAREYAGRSFKFSSKTVRYLQPFFAAAPDESDSVLSPTKAARDKREAQKAARHARALSKHQYQWTFCTSPPPRHRVQEWCGKHRQSSAALLAAPTKRTSDSAPPRQQGGKATQAADTGFKLSQRKPTVLAEEKHYMTTFAIEVHICTRGSLMPDPRKDPISAIAYSYQNEDENLEDTGSRPNLLSGLILCTPDEGAENSAGLLKPERLGLGRLKVDVVSSELDLFNSLIDLVRALDPEILVGWEIHNSSWGYIIERALRELDFELIAELGRVNTGSTGIKGDKWGYTQSSAMRVTGRHLLNIWRLMRGELTLGQYTFENVVFQLLRRRTPRFDHATLTKWYRSGVPHLVRKTLLYWMDRVETDLEILENSELIFRTAEFARIYGVDFFSVISRGSQFKVESVMLRIAKPENFILPSPSQQQVGEQNAAEDLPLVMEPQSAFYKGPLVVLDFQSLYPSIMIAYNICYSTCLGRVNKFKDTWKLGFTEYAPPDGLLSLLIEDCFVSPNGLVYAKPHLRKSLLAKMLTEILDTRVMVKGSMKGSKDRAFKRLQNARQLSLKLLANVTYGYTSATFSGRMPCVEVADSIVQYGRETLERAITTIHATAEWGAQVVYGDTDSLFIYLPGRSKDDAFRVGNAMAETISADNPAPVKLKFEKVYLPCLLMAKKRYVGFMYETPDQEEPAFNAKGIETVRRDGFPAQQRMVEACIRILFRTQDLSLIKSYCQRQWRKIMEGLVPFQDFIIAKEVRLGTYR